MRKILSFFFISLSICGCNSNRKHQPTFKAEAIGNAVTNMTDIMVHDITNPPLAARFFSYACLSGYEVVSQNNSTYKSMYGVLHDYPKIAKPDTITGYSYQLAALLAMLETAQKMQPSGKRLQEYEQRLLDSCINEGYDEDMIEESRKYARYISKAILAYAKSDRYNRISNLPRYTPSNMEGHWYPTPPAYMAAVEPEFRTVRAFTLDSSAQFKATPPTAFSKERNSPFFQMIHKNYDIKLTDEQKVIAAFWDCNPFAVRDNGHLLTSLKKISPGAHWLGITGIACGKAEKSFDESMQIFTLVSVGMMDSFIACWDEKFRSNQIRPETAIRNYVDPDWKPFLQTPPFPEYLSGHSCISATSATILTHYFGENFQYTDSVEVGYGLPARSFKSFHQAASEAGISRFYGGIHFMEAIEEGQKQGNKVGAWVLKSFAGSKETTSPH